MTTEAPAPATPPIAGVSPIVNAPLTPEAAAQRMIDLKADPEFMRRVEARDPAAFEDYNKAWRVAHGLPETPQPPQSPVEVNNETDARVIAAVQQHAGFYRDRGYSEEQQIEIVGQRPITVEERKWHEQQYEMKRSSPAFMAKWSAGDLEAVRDMQRHAIAMRLPLGTLDDIKRWGGE
jgi:hypothetical protein